MNGKPVYLSDHEIPDGYDEASGSKLYLYFHEGQKSSKRRRRRRVVRRKRRKGKLLAFLVALLGCLASWLLGFLAAWLIQCAVFWLVLN